jgi:hypothetical protein
MEAERWRPQGRRGPEAGCRGQPCAAGLAPTRALETSVAHGSADVGQPLDGTASGDLAPGARPVSVCLVTR